MESIKSIQENPFYKNFGIKHVSSLSRSSPNLATHEPATRRSSGRLANDDDIGEYRPVSGFVHKLLDKFSSLSAKEEQAVTLLVLKRSTSLDEPAVETETTKKRPVSSVGTYLDSKPSYLSDTKLSQRAKSVESLNHIHHKAHQHHSNAGRIKQQGAKQEKENSAVLDGSRKDLELNKSNIVIIEKTPPVYPFRNDDKTSKLTGSNDGFFVDELPKPNTVLTVRSIFENVSSVSGFGHTKRRKSDAPLSSSSPLQTSTVAVSQDSLTSQVSARSLSPVTSPRLISDTYAKHKVSSTFSETSDNSKCISDSSLYSRSDAKTHDHLKSSSGENIAPSGRTTSFLESNSQLSDKSPNVDRTNIFNSTESDNRQSVSSPRSTASVKPTLNSQQSAPVKPIPLSPPASASTSYSRSRPVVSVAPYKDKLDVSSSAQPVIILSKSQLTQKREKPYRVKDYSQNSDEPKEDRNEEAEQNRNNVIPKEMKKVHKKSDNIKKNDQSSDSKIVFRETILSNDRADNDTSDQSKIMYSKSHTTIEVRNSLKSTSNIGLPMSNKTESAKKVIDHKPPQVVIDSSTHLTNSKRMAPEPPVQLGHTVNNMAHSVTLRQPASLSNKNSSHAATPVVHSHLETYKDKTTSNKQTHPGDASAPNEMASKKPSTGNPDSEEQPVKGIPSIIAQRMKQQKSDPSQAASDMVSSSENALSNAADSNKFSKIALTSVAVSGGNDTKDPVPVENEIMIVRRKMEEKRSRSSSPAPIFNSSQLSKRKKDSQPVPPLDLSDVVDGEVTEYQPQPKKIMPCNILFTGENAKTSRSLLDKKRKIKVRVHFVDAKAEVFEYIGEDVALEKYLEEHPEEKAEILVLEDLSGGGEEFGESSDDVDMSHSDSLMKSNTGLAHSEGLQSYRGRFQQEYEFGDVLIEQPKSVVNPEPEVDPDKLMLRPAEEENNTWSTSDSSDILF